LAREVEGASPSAMEKNKASKKAYVYMVTNYGGNVLYTGSTEALKERIYQHKKRLVPGFTQKYNVHKLVYFEEQPSIECAERREKQLKGKNRAKKNAIVESINPQWDDLCSRIK
jgi:putative endonuclease